ncbi:MAG: hypothetical protein SVY53_12050 [Chloroflexota bacterium]|nr:hypothetical protein [Chloroflexota bacterium]
MYKLDEEILRSYFRLEKYQEDRLKLERIWHPEKMNWNTAPPEMCATTHIKLEELEKIGYGKDLYMEVLANEKAVRKEIEELATQHHLWVHTQHISCMGKYLTGAFIAAGGDITRAPTVSAFWKGMGLDVLPDGQVPRRIRGKKLKRDKDGNIIKERNIPALPHVTKLGNQIREQIMRSGNLTKDIYDEYKAYYAAKYPDRPNMYNHKGGARVAQKLLYAVLWEEWRKGYGLAAPWPYAFDILNHAREHKLTIYDFYGEKPKRKRNPVEQCDG